MAKRAGLSLVEDVALPSNKGRLNKGASDPLPARELDTLTIYYDGQCPLCQAEIQFLAARNRQGLLNFVDIGDKTFVDGGHPVSCAEAMAQIRGRLSDSQLLTGIPVFVEAYRRANLPILAWLLSRTWLKPILDLGYRWFARHRHPISRMIGPSLLRLTRRWCQDKVNR